MNNTDLINTLNEIKMYADASHKTGCSFDAQSIGSAISKATGMNAPELINYAKKNSSAIVEVAIDIQSECIGVLAMGHIMNPESLSNSINEALEKHKKTVVKVEEE